MPDLPQRWLSLSGICTVLNLTPSQVKTLYRNKFLVRIGKNPPDYRYLDPTPEYAERLRLAAVMLSKNHSHNIPIDLPLTSLLTMREIAEIMDWSLHKTVRLLERGKVPCFKGKNRVRLFSVSDVRDFIWKRNGRKNKYTAPLLLSELIVYFRRFQAAEEAIVPTDAQFAADEALQKKITWLMKQPNREVLLADFIQKVELAKQVLGTAGRDESGTHQ